MHPPGNIHPKYSENVSDNLITNSFVYIKANSTALVKAAALVELLYVPAGHRRHL